MKIKCIWEHNGGTILECRERGFEQLEKYPEFLALGVFTGSYNE